MIAETISNQLKPGDSVVVRASPGTSHLINLVISDGTTVEFTITGNSPCNIVCGDLGMNINIHNAPTHSANIIKINNIDIQYR